MSGRIYSIQAENSVEFIEKIDQLDLSIDTDQIFVCHVCHSQDSLMYWTFRAYVVIG